jgi:hypothetical protein
VVIKASSLGVTFEVVVAWYDRSSGIVGLSGSVIQPFCRVVCEVGTHVKGRCAMIGPSAAFQGIRYVYGHIEMH